MDKTLYKMLVRYLKQTKGRFVLYGSEMGRIDTSKRIIAFQDFTQLRNILGRYFSKHDAPQHRIH